MRRKLIFGNWKMNKTRKESEIFAKESVALLEFANENGIDIGIAPAFLSLPVLKCINPKLCVAAQNCFYEESGAFTGEVSIPMLKDVGISCSLVGHSERRSYFNETNLITNKKLHALLKNDMTPILCVGESLEEFENGNTKGIVKNQICDAFLDISASDAKKVIVAYEPVWSIGTGKNASSEIAEDICKYIRQLLAELFGVEVASQIRILYGGSVKPDNIRAYLMQDNVDGALVGGASLSVDSFKALISNIL